MNNTMIAFDYPTSQLASFEHWVVLLRPKQVTLGSMVLVIRDPDTCSVGEVSLAAAKELPLVAASLERVLGVEFGAVKFNYLCLMMVDPQVHFHVIPRYFEPAALGGILLADKFWPGPPDLSASLDLQQATLLQIHGKLKSAFENDARRQVG